MDVIDEMRQVVDDDDDAATVTLLSMRVFNSLGSATSTGLSGYYQSAAMILRDVLETVFLLDYFGTDRALIARWRTGDTRARDRDFKPVKVRQALDERDGTDSRMRERMYKMFCDLASHPSPNGFSMLRPKGMDAVNGPFFDVTAMEALLSELGRLAIQVGYTVPLAHPAKGQAALPERLVMASFSRDWMEKFYSDAAEELY